MLKVLDYDDLPEMPRLILTSFAVVADRFMFNIEASAEQTKAWYGAWQAAHTMLQQSAQQTAPQAASQSSLEESQVPDSLAKEAQALRNKDAAQLESTRRIASGTVVLLVTFSAVLAFLFRHAIVGKEFAACDYGCWRYDCMGEPGNWDAREMTANKWIGRWSILK